ncbi:MAG TPA: SulP family inorganic anion transporter, partial [Ornithinibacter sp.]|nr:SulP family inorganic anion transporter [Ornithinibacter sp.]
ATGLLAGVNPILALHAYLVGTIAGAVTTSTVLMSVQATGAMAVVISDVPQTQTGDARAQEALAVLALLTGLMMLTLGLARLGSLVRFVPSSVLVGFVNAVAINIMLSQVDEVTGYQSDAGGRVGKALDTLLHPGQLDYASVAIAALTIVLIVVLERTRLGALGMVVAIALGSALPVVLGALGATALAVPMLADIVSVPNGLPDLDVPSLALVPAMLVPAFSLVFVGLVQGAAIGGTMTNPDGSANDPSGDFRGQGVANLATGVLQGMPVAGSMSATNLVRAAGARTATANLAAGLVMAATMLLFADVVGYVAMPALGGLLVLIGWRSLKVDQLVLTWRTGPVPATTMAITFVLTLLIPLQYAVLVGVGLAVLLHVARQANRVVVKHWVFDDDDGFPSEADPPAVVPAGEVVVLATYGSLFFASAPAFEGQLPRPVTGAHAVVVLRLRAKEELGSTVIKVLIGYAEQLAASGSRLMLAGLTPGVRRQVDDTGLTAVLGADALFMAQPRVGLSVREAVEHAERWIEESAAATGSGEG